MLEADHANYKLEKRPRRLATNRRTGAHGFLAINSLSSFQDAAGSAKSVRKSERIKAAHDSSPTGSNPATVFTVPRPRARFAAKGQSQNLGIVLADIGNYTTTAFKLQDITKEGGGPWRDSSWRDSLRGQTSLRRECLRGEILSVERVLRGEKRSAERFFKERLSPWREQPRRDNLQGENVSVERLFEERGAPGRTRPALNLQSSIEWFTSLLIRLVYFLQQFPYAFVQSG
ncbi:uncharacterized protein BDR25DRAFT_361873 [Lindgomyces ingoldianus]|uniref:Uncharacterized protein n=1 Tax=Lindgomyces ingoldianus TaxID=673940 RepID=A0ACB6QC05_9PLEO|nr:uncharacterized protein BDR25DRAFT_361873 [Lindgomyces ingoldianus]KAF2464138.1 hypothetical protein BDR25DRAFT_361873 [Lindgomyces ingoldianus]